MHPDLIAVPLLGGERVVHTYGALLVLGAAAAIWLTVTRARKFGIERFDALAIGLFAIGGGILGATLLHIVVHWRDLLTDPLALLARPGLVFYGGFLGGGAGVAIYCRLYKIPLSSAADCAVPGIALGHAIGRVGCFFAGCCYGKEVAANFPLVVVIAGAPRHPVQLYEAAGLLLLCSATLLIRAKPPGRLTALYLIGYAVLRLFTESLRGDGGERGYVIPNLLSTSQAIAIAIVVTALALLYRSKYSATR